ncbi:hypothetical protein [Thermococcus pacificus]|uniref:KaiC-like domain-containing protein n=1 Tax=Thermococcus pacificus TaxID=71998 RepID=A0A218P7S3_9EURY|nr:hypothetical protein [Thermococcus pacificus]ASJ06824.1 hypothetical protein A3L08_05570 [Thermococcus pacificus]
MFLTRAIEKGYFTVVSNYSVPLRSFVRHGVSVGLDVEKALSGEKMAIIDVFDSGYAKLKDSLPGVFYLDSVEPETINPKLDRIYCEELEEKLRSGKALRVIYTLDGAALMLGEENTLRLLNQTVAAKSVGMPNSILLLPVNADIVSKRFVAWISNISDYVLLAKSWIREDHIKEILYLIKAPNPDFEPAVYSMKIKKGANRIRLKKLRSAPELRPPAEEER